MLKKFVTVGVSSVPATVYAALELSRSGWLLAVLRLGERRAAHHRVKAGDAPGVVALLEEARRASATPLTGPVRVCCCYEAGYEGFWLHRWLAAAGIESFVVDPASLQVDRRARRRKTDALDVETILRALIAWDHGERAKGSMVVVPDAAVEDDRRISRERERLVRQRTAHLNRIVGLLRTVGAARPARFDAATLAAIRGADGRPLPPCLAAEIGRERDRLDIVRRHIIAVERERDAPGADPTAAGQRRRLQLLCSIGPELASVLQREVFHRQFANRRQVGAYCGLDPSPYASGDTCREQGISKAGNPRARRALIELAWLWLRYQPKSALSRWFDARVGHAAGRHRRVMIVALARKLAIALWRFLETGLVPHGARVRG
jgi:transposase